MAHNLLSSYSSAIILEKETGNTLTVSLFCEYIHNSLIAKHELMYISIRWKDGSRYLPLWCPVERAGVLWE